MIQRAQSLYLTGIIAIIGVLCFGSMFEQWDPSNGQRYSLNLNEFRTFDKNGTLLTAATQWTTLIPAILVAAFTIAIIFSYKNRPRQIKMCWWNYLLIILLIALTVSGAFRNIPGFDLKEAFKSSLFGCLLSLFLLYLNFRAIMLIKRDEDLVRSADRIR